MALIESVELPLGWQAQDFSLHDTEEDTYTLSNFSGNKGLLVIFTCNHCPYAKAAWPLTIILHEKFKEDIGFVAINPNDAQMYPEDSFEQMKVKKQDWKIPFPYLRDETQEVAKAYKAQCTPDLYLFKNKNGSFNLYYHGRINDNWQNPKRVTERNLEDALQKLVNGEEPPGYQPPSMGCSIKWSDTAFA